MAAIQTIYRNALKPGQQLANYEVLEVLGQGSFGITYLCEERQNGCLVAIKEYLPGQFAQREANDNLQPLSDDHEEEFVRGLARFISEAAHLDRFVHPNIVRILDVFQANNTAYLVMNYEQGESLHAVLGQRGKLTEAEIREILFPVLDGLEAMHNEGLIHRDIKPSNIFIREDGSPVLLDFGSARLAMMERLSQTLTNIVTPGYAPIEQYATKREKQGPWTDIYGLGATLYKVVCGEPPIEAVARAESILHDARDPYVPALQRAQSEYSASLLGAIDCALRFRAQERPQSVNEWRTNLQSTQQSQNVIALNDDDAPTERAPYHHRIIAEWFTRTTPADQKSSHAVVDTNKSDDYANGRRLRPAAGMFFAANLIVVAAAAFVAPNTGTDSATVRTNAQWELRMQAMDPARIPHAQTATFDTPSFLEISTAKPDSGPVSLPLDLNGNAHYVEEHLTVPLAPVTKVAGVSSEHASARKPETEAAQINTSPETVPAGDTTKQAKGLAADSKSNGSSRESTQQKSHIEHLLKLAASEVVTLNAKTDAQLNPIGKYREVLAIDSENAAAKAGLMHAAEKYLDLVYTDLDTNDLTQARNHLRAAAAVMPNADRVKDARAAVRAKRAALALKNDQEGAHPGGPSGEFVPDLARHTPPAAPSRFDELRRRMAGERIP